ncbi:MAG: HDIG domain-containing protein [Clostridia bacterium]
MASKQKETTDKSFIKNFLISLMILILVAVLIWIFVTLWFSGREFSEFFKSYEILSSLALVFVIVFLLMALYGFIHFFTPETSRIKNLIIVSLVLLITLILCIICADKLNVYAMPISLCAVLLCVLINGKVALAGNLILSQMLLAIFMVKMPFSATTMANVTGAIFCNTMSGCVLLYLLTKNYTRMRFILVGIAAGLVMAPFATIVSLALKSSASDILGNTLWVIAANIISVVMYMPLVPIFESVFNVITDFKLDELCSFSQPLLKRLSTEAPGSFNHSIVVGNLAENCALAIGENTHLARAGSYYHDVGKLRSPEFFIENQKNGYNPHDDLIPEVSVSMITKHTKNGAQLIRDSRLPEEIALIANEHHGTSPVNFFYYKAQKITEGKLADEEYRYDGPKPTSKISAIIMICDTVEAASRAIRPEDNDALTKLIDKLVKEKLDLGQFDECKITMSDLAAIKRTIVDVLPGIFHARIEYKK